MHKTVLLSIKPEFADKILDGTKTYEFRRVLFKDRNVKTIILYATSPVQRIVGECEVADVLSLSKHALWRKTRSGAAISWKYFDTYFYESVVCHAIQLQRPKRYTEAIKLKEAVGLSHPPQSFVYVSCSHER